MTTVLNHVAKKERFTLPPSAADSIVEEADGNLRKALLVMEALRMQKPDLDGDVEVAKPDWELYCSKIADLIMQEQSPQRLLEIRSKVYELLSHCIPPAVVLKVSLGNRHPLGFVADGRLTKPQTIADGLVNQVEEALKPVVIHWAAHYVSYHMDSLTRLTRSGTTDASWIKEDLPHRGVHRQDHEGHQGGAVVSLASKRQL